MQSLDQRLRERIAETAIGRLFGIELSPVGHAERLISMLGGFLAILALILLERDLLGATGAAMLTGSMGATAVLLFAVPHGALSQPWAVLVGHVASAAVGVTVAKMVSDPVIAAAASVGLAILVMHYLRAIHPPGGATALTAVIGGPAVHDLGYGFVVTPVLVNAVVMVAAAVAINMAFAWRRYPAGLRRKPPASAPRDHTEAMTHADFVAALSRIGTFVDISEDEFLELRALMREAAERRKLRPDEILLGACYSNGGQGDAFAVRWVVDEEPLHHGGRVIWRVVAGRDRDQTGLSTREDFAAWACCAVRRVETTWIRAEATVAAATSEAI
ncbi:MAG: HPP family protein [Hyphomicrobiaceae bacterium]